MSPSSRSLPNDAMQATAAPCRPIVADGRSKPSVLLVVPWSPLPAGSVSTVRHLIGLAPPDVTAVVVRAAMRGHLEIVDDGVSGLVSSSEDVSACASALQAALSDRDASSHRAAAVRRRFDLQQTARVLFGNEAAPASTRTSPAQIRGNT